LADDVVTEILEVLVSGCEEPMPFVGDKAPDTDTALVFVPVPTSEPFAEAAELGTPPARAELREYTEEMDIRFELMSDRDGRERTAESGSSGCFEASAIMPGESLGVSKSSTATSSLLVVRLRANPCFHISDTLVALEL
jgi:hypothetical protein